ncbi:hypothetical protein D9M72_182350 [compost metagenome]
MVVAALAEIEFDAVLVVADRRQAAGDGGRGHVAPALPFGAMALGGRQLARVEEFARGRDGEDDVAPVGAARRGGAAGGAFQQGQVLPGAPAAVDAGRRDPVKPPVIAQGHGGGLAARRHGRDLRHAHAAQRLPALPGAVMALLVRPHAAQRVARHQAGRAVGVRERDQRAAGAPAQALPAALAGVPAVDGGIGFARREHHEAAASVGVQLRRHILARHVIGALHPGGGRPGGFFAARRPGAIVVVVPGVVLEDHRLGGDLGFGQVGGAFLARIVDIARFGIVAGHAHHGLAHQPRAGDVVRVPMAGAAPAQLGIGHGDGVVQVAHRGGGVLPDHVGQGVYQLFARVDLGIGPQRFDALPGFGFGAAERRQAAPAFAQPGVFQPHVPELDARIALQGEAREVVSAGGSGVFFPDVGFARHVGIGGAHATLAAQHIAFALAGVAGGQVDHAHAAARLDVGGDVRVHEQQVVIQVGDESQVLDAMALRQRGRRCERLIGKQSGKSEK